MAIKNQRAVLEGVKAQLEEAEEATAVGHVRVHALKRRMACQAT